MTAYWEHFEHMADIGVRGIGDTLAAAFEQAALAMTAVITDIELIEPRDVLEIACEAPDHEILFADWLNTLIYEMATRRMLFSRFEVAIDGMRLQGRAWGEPVNVARHQPGVEIKGATFTELRVGRLDELWLAQCVLDV